MSPEVAVAHVSAPQSVQPGETLNLAWQTTSDAPIAAAALEWGTVSGSHPNTVTAHSTVSSVSSGTQPWVATFSAPESTGTVYYVVTARNTLGATATTSELQLPVQWVTPTGALAFETDPGTAIQGGAPAVSVPLVVTAQGTVAAAYVRVEISIPRRGDLALSLVSPSGTTARLLVPSTDPTPDVVGTFGDTLAAADSLGTFVGQDLGGTWQLVVSDQVAGETGVVHSVTLMIQPAATANGVEALPDLQPVPPYDLSVAVVDSGRLISFSNSVQNVGDGPLEFRPVTDPSTGVLQAVQRIYAASRDSSGNLQWQVVRDVPVGTMFFTDYGGVPHYNLDGFAHYSLLDASFNALETTDKVSYCVDDGGYAYQDPSLPNYNANRVYWCGMQAQGISVGHADTYAGGCAQELLLASNEPDGVYYLVTESTSVFLEKNDDRVNNTAAVKIQIRGSTITVLETLDGATFAALKAAAGK